MMDHIKTLWLLPLLAFAAACGSTKDPTPAEIRDVKILSFRADPAEIAAGASSTLSWRTSDAERVRVLDGSGDALTLANPERSVGSVEVTPTETTIYTLEAIRGDEVVSAEITVSILDLPLPAITFAADAEAIDWGSSARLSWSVPGASKVVLSADSAIILEDDASSGELEVSPERKTTYELKATGPGGTSEATVTVSVRPMVVTFLAEDEGVAVPEGGLVLLRWETGGAEAVEISNDDGFSYDVSVDELAEGTVEAPVSATGKFRLVATLEASESVREVEVEVLQAPTIATFEANPARLTASTESAGTTTLSWTTEGAEAVEILAIPGGAVDVGGAAGASGSLVLSLAETTTFELIATNPAGIRTASVEVEVYEPAAIVSFSALPSRVGAGESVELSWVTAGAAAVAIDQDGVEIDGGQLPLTGSHELQIAEDSLFTLRAINEAGDVVERSVAVEVGAPRIVSFEADVSQVFPGETVDFSWVNEGGVSLDVIGPTGPIAGCASTDPSTIAAGGCPMVAPNASGLVEFELLVVNGKGQESRESLSLMFLGGPNLDSFTSSESKLSVGDELVLTWSVSSEAPGSAPTVELEDDRGTTYDLGTPAPLQGSHTIVLTESGPRTYTLTASMPGYEPVSQELSVEVFENPTVALSTGSNPYDPSEGLPFTLDWTASDAVTLVIDEMEGDEVRSTFSASAQDLQAGHGALVPSVSGPLGFVAVATNGAGKSVSDRLDVALVASEVVTFDAAPDELVQGDLTTLSWETVGIRSITFSPNAMSDSVTHATGPYLDVSNNPDAITVGFDTCGTSDSDEGCAFVDFPDGFAFPFFGEDRVFARIYVNGVISFDVDRTGPSGAAREALPSEDYAWVHLAPFWENLRYGNGSLLEGSGVIALDVGSDAKGRYLVVQWKNFSTKGQTNNRINFEVVMWEDGDFEYRYGTMGNILGATTRTKGGEAVIGYQSPLGGEGATASAFQEVSDLSFGRAFSLPRGIRDGSFVVQPRDSATYVLTAQGFDGEIHTRSVSVIAHEVPTISAELSAPTVEDGSDFEIIWRTTNAVSVAIFDEDGAALYSAEEDEVAFGTLTLPASSVGLHDYTVVVTGALGREVSEVVTMEVTPAFGIASFEAAPAEVQVAGSTWLSWVAHGADSIELTGNGVPIDTTGMIVDADSIELIPGDTTEYVLQVSRSSDGRSDSKALVVRVIRASLDSVSVSRPRIAEGGTVDVSWSATAPAGDPISVQVVPAAMTELDPTEVAFEDISISAPELTAFVNKTNGAATVNFPTGFTFPYMGELYSSVRVLSDGYLSFASLGASSTPGNVRLPDFIVTGGVQLAPFWTDLHSYSTGHVFAGHIDDHLGERFIVQWQGFQYLHTTAAVVSLNFQVVLFPNGSFDFRYGGMSSDLEQHRADGSTATIGYQDPTGRFGDLILFKEAKNGGLSNRAWRFDADQGSTGTLSVSPARNGEIMVCATAADDRDCRIVQVVVESPGDLAFTEVQLDPIGTDQWFELRNLSDRVVTLDGMELVSGSDRHTITPANPLVLPPGAFVTMAAGGNPGFTPDYVFGSGLSLDASGGDLAVEFDGTTLTKVEWDASWAIAPGVSLSLDGTKQVKRIAASTFADPSSWCASLPSYSGGNLGTPGAAGASCLSVYDVDFYSDMPFIDIYFSGDPVASLGFREILGGLPFDFPFYGQGTRNVLFANGGTIGFGGSCTFGICSMNATQGTISILGNTPYLAEPGGRLSHEVRTVNGLQVSILQWTNLTTTTELQLIGQPVPRIGQLTLQVQLWESGDIVMVYRDLEGLDAVLGKVTTGLSIKVGTVTETISYSVNEATLRPGQSIHYRLR